MKEYKVFYEDTVEMYTAEELINFIKIAIINNKDVNSFKVERIKKYKHENNSNNIY